MIKLESRGSLRIHFHHPLDMKLGSLKAVDMPPQPAKISNTVGVAPSIMSKDFTPRGSSKAILYMDDLSSTLYNNSSLSSPLGADEEDEDAHDELVQFRECNSFRLGESHVFIRVQSFQIVSFH